MHYDVGNVLAALFVAAPFLFWVGFMYRAIWAQSGTFVLVVGLAVFSGVLLLTWNVGQALLMGYIAPVGLMLLAIPVAAWWDFARGRLREYPRGMGQDIDGHPDDQG